jgi:hypothetical protein
MSMRGSIVIMLIALLATSCAKEDPVSPCGSESTPSGSSKNLPTIMGGTTDQTDAPALGEPGGPKPPDTPDISDDGDDLSDSERSRKKRR